MTDVLRLTDALPAVVDTSPALEAALRDLAAGEGPLGVDAERAGSYRYSQRAYLVQVYRRRAPVLLLDPVEIDDFSTPLRLLAYRLEFTDPVDSTPRRFTSARQLHFPTP